VSAFSATSRCRERPEVADSRLLHRSIMALRGKSSSTAKTDPKPTFALPAAPTVVNL